MSVTVFSIACITICMYGMFVCYAQNIKYFVQENSELTNIYWRVTNKGRITCAKDCAKDPWCLAFVYDERLQTCDLSSFTPDESISWTKTKQGSRLYYQKIEDLKAVSGIAVWPSSVWADDTFASLAIDGNNGTVHEFCFATQNASGNYLIVELKKMSNLVHVDILFRTDLPDHWIVRNTDITVLVANSKTELETNQAKVCGHYVGPPADPYHPGRVKCAPNTTGEYVKFLHNIYNILNMCEVSFYTK